MNYKAELVVVTTVGKIDVIVKDEKMLYLPNRKNIRIMSSNSM